MADTQWLITELPRMYNEITRYDALLLCNRAELRLIARHFNVSVPRNYANYQIAESIAQSIKTDWAYLENRYNV